MKRRCCFTTLSPIEGVLHHETDLEIDRQFVDTHGQSVVGFAFCYLLGFELMIQDVLGDQAWRAKMTTRNMAALNLLPHSHINPYGVFDLDMNTRLPLSDMPVAA